MNNCIQLISNKKNNGACVSLAVGGIERYPDKTKFTAYYLLYISHVIQWLPV